MADNLFTGVGAYIPQIPFGWLMSSTPSSFLETTGINAGNKKYAYIGRLWNKDHSAKQIRSVGFKLGTIVKSLSTTDVQVSIQGVSTTTTFAPNGTVSGATNNCLVNIGYANLVTNAWVNTSNFTEDSSSIDFGALFAIVFEFSTFNAGDNFALQGLSNLAQLSFNQSSSAYYNGASWGVGDTNVSLNCYVKFSDGTYGCMEGAFLTDSVGSITYNNGSATKEVAMEFTVDNDLIVDGAWIQNGLGNNLRDFDFVLWEDDTVLMTTSIDNTQVTLAANNAVFLVPFDTTYTLTTGKTYRLSRKPQTAGDATLYYYDVNNNDHFECQQWGKNFYYNTHNGTSWGTAVTTRRLWAGLRVCGWPATAAGNYISDRGSILLLV